MKEFRSKRLQFEEELDSLFIGNSATGENAWVPMGDDPKQSEVPMPDELDMDVQAEYMEPFNIAVLLDSADVDDVKHILSKKRKTSIDKLPTRPRNAMKGELTQCVQYFTEVTKAMMSHRQSTTQPETLSQSIKASVDILNNTEGVEVGSAF